MTDNKMMELSRWLSEIQKQELHYDSNILYANSNNNENWHSRVLRVLFEYRDFEYHDGNHHVLSSFIGMMKRKGGYPNLELPQGEAVVCSNEKYHIDLLVEIGNKSAIIIENKINWAVDQDSQIERYVEQIRNNPLLDKSNIYVVYLTADGTKRVEEYSLTNKAKEWLKGTQDNEGIHFLPLSYADDILPWLENEMLPDIPYQSGLGSEYGSNNILLYSIILYVNYLKNRFRRDETNQTITTKLINKMEQENIKMDSLEDAFLAQEQAAKFAERVTLAKEQKMKEVAQRCIIEPLSEYVQGLGLRLENAIFTLGNFDIIIANDIVNNKWSKCKIHLGIWQYKNYGGLRYIDPHGNALLPEELTALREKFIGWKGDNSEPVWNYFDNAYRSYYTLEAWQVIESGAFEKYIESFIKEIYDRVQGLAI